MTLEKGERLVKAMKLNSLQIQKLVEKVFEHWKKEGIVTFKEDEKKIFAKGCEYIQADYQKEVQLEKDAMKMVDDLERQHSGEFQRHKMFLMIKQKLAKDRKVVL